VRVAIAGGDGTGKTTLARALAAELAVPVLDPLKLELLADSGYHTIFEWDAATNRLPDAIAAQAEREHATNDVVIDGCTCELLALVQRWAWARVSPKHWERLRQVAVDASRRYDRLIILPATVVGGPASGRFRSPEHNMQLRRLLVAFASEVAVPVTLLEDGDEKARIARVLADLRARA
jgi:nicotinamide riboside kinase